MIHVHDTLEMVAFMLHHSRCITAYLLFVGLEILVEIAETDMLHTFYILAQSREAEATFRTAYLWAVEGLYLRIDERALEAVALREVLGQR